MEGVCHDTVAPEEVRISITLPDLDVPTDSTTSTASDASSSLRFNFPEAKTDEKADEKKDPMLLEYQKNFE